MDFATYEKTGQARYARLAATVAAILDVTVRGPSNLRTQQIQHRAKAPKSLAKKIADRDGALTDDIERHAKDVAGCRAIFYTNDDVQQFVQSSVISDNFEVDWDRTKFHYPQDEADETLFISYNYVVRLKAQRTDLPEYADLADLWCEIQVQTTLDHAWSEMHHDTVYKPPKAGFGSAMLADVGARMAKIMQDHLLPAGYDFQKVSDDIRRLDSARALYETDPLSQAAALLDNNQRYDLIKRFGEVILPYLDDVVAEAPKIRAALLAAVDEGARTPVTPQVYIGGELRGRTVDEVIDVALGVADRLRYVDETSIAATWALAGEMLDRATGDKAQARIAKTVEHLAEQNLHFWKRAGPFAQTEVSKLLPAALETPGRRSLAAAAAGAILSSAVRGTTSGFDTVTIHQGAVTPSPQLASARATALSILETLIFGTTGTEREMAFDALLKATEYPNFGGKNPGLAKLIDEASLVVVEIAARLAPGVDLAFRAHIEQAMFRVYRRLQGPLQAGKAEGEAARETDDEAHAELAALREKLGEELRAFAVGLNADAAFTTHKTLVGFRNVTEADWERGTLDLKSQREERKAAIQVLVTAANLDAYDDRVPSILEAAGARSSDGATFTQFREFLAAIGREQPDFALRLIAEHEEPLGRFLAELLGGLAAGPRRAEREVFLTRWIAEGRHLDQVLAATYRLPDDAALFARAAEVIVAGPDDNMVLQLVDAASKVASDRPEVISRVLLPAIARAARADPDTWVHATWYAWDEKFVARFSDTEIDTVLALMTSIPRIATDEDWILGTIAQAYPRKVLDLFNRRMAHGRQAGDDDAEALPYDLHQLAGPFAAHPEEVVEHLRSWYPHDWNLFEYSGGRFLKAVFPDLAPVEALLMPFATGTDDDRDFLVKLLRAYEGWPTIDGLARAVIAASANESDAWKAVAIALDNTGVVSGEFGFVEAYADKKARLQTWLEDARPPVQRFAEAHIRRLEREIAAERRRSVETFNLRKRRYGEA